MNATKKTPPAWRQSILYKIAKVCFIGLLCLVTLAALIWQVEYFRGSRAWSKHVDQLDARGEPWRPEELIPPQVPEDENFAMIPLLKGFYESEVNHETGEVQWIGSEQVILSIYSNEKNTVFRPKLPRSGSWRSGERTDLVGFQDYYRALAGRESIDGESGREPFQGMDRRMMERYGLAPEAIESKMQEVDFGPQPTPEARREPMDGESGRESSAGMDKKMMERYGLAPEAIESKMQEVDPVPQPAPEWVPVKDPEFPVPEIKGSAGEDVLLALTGYEANYQAINQGLQRPHSRFPIRYQDGFDALFVPHLAMIKGCSQYYRLKATAELSEGNVDQALVDVVNGLRLAQTIATEPLLISHLVRIAVIQIMLQPIWEGWVDERWEPEHIQVLSDKLRAINLPAEAAMSLRGERALAWVSIDRRVLSHEFSEVNRPFLTHLKGWVNFNRVGYSEAIQIMIDGLQEDEAGWLDVESLKVRVDSMTNRLEEEGLTPYNWLVKTTLPGFSKIAIKPIYTQTYVDLAQVALGCLGYRKAHGKWPENLEVLVPEYVDEVPMDLVTGQPLHYRLTDEGQQFLLYSVGWDLSDDGGQEVFNKSNHPIFEEGDWVWPWPTSDME